MLNTKANLSSLRLVFLLTAGSFLLATFFNSPLSVSWIFKYIYSLWLPLYQEKNSPVISGDSCTWILFGIQEGTTCCCPLDRKCSFTIVIRVCIISLFVIPSQATYRFIGILWYRNPPRLSCSSGIFISKDSFLQSISSNWYIFNLQVTHSSSKEAKI